MTPEDLIDRLLTFEVRVGKVVDALPETMLGRISPGSSCGAEHRLAQIMRRRVRQKVALISHTN